MADDPGNRLVACRHIQEIAKRLSCYDGVLDELIAAAQKKTDAEQHDYGPYNDGKYFLPLTNAVPHRE